MVNQVRDRAVLLSAWVISLGMSLTVGGLDGGGGRGRGGRGRWQFGLATSDASSTICAPLHRSETELT